MSVIQAAAVVVPCGLSKGKLMGDEGNRSVYWFATRTVSTSTSKSMRDAICAARILRTSRQVEKAGDDIAAKLHSSARHEFDNAKRAVVECNSCGVRSAVWRNILDRRGRPTCYSCGGTLCEVDFAPVDDYISIREAAEEYGVPKTVVQRQIALGRVLCRMHGSRRVVGRASLESALDLWREEKAAKL